MLVVDLHILWKDKLKQWKFWTRNSFKYIEVSVTSDNKIRFVSRSWYLMVQEVVAEDFYFFFIIFFLRSVLFSLADIWWFRKLWRRMRPSLRMEATVTRRLTTCSGWRGRFRESLNRMDNNRGAIPEGCQRSTLTRSCRQGSPPQPTPPPPRTCRAEIGQDTPPPRVGRSWGWRTRCTRWTGEGWRWPSPSTSPTTSHQSCLANLMKKASWSATGETK